MKITQLYVYPIKSLRGTKVSEALVVETGFQYDRTFMLLKVLDGDAVPQKLQNMHVSTFTEMSLFRTEIIPSSSQGSIEGSIVITYSLPNSTEAPKVLTIPLEPDVNGLVTFDVVMHQSPTKAFNMGTEFNSWFSSCFGYEVILAYIGENKRPILGSFSASAGNSGYTKAAGLFSGLLSYTPLANTFKSQGSTGITFADCASFLVVTEESVKDASARLPDGEDMDVTKFRPNIVVEGAAGAWEEDYWGGITTSSESAVDIVFTANCVRCASLNVDYATGKPGLGESGKILKKLMKDRRVDSGAKYSPVFGRYGYLERGINNIIKVGDGVDVSRRLEERTTWDWPGLTN